MIFSNYMPNLLRNKRLIITHLYAFDGIFVQTGRARIGSHIGLLYCNVIRLQHDNFIT